MEYMNIYEYMNRRHYDKIHETTIHTCIHTGSNLVLQWVPRRGKVVRGDTKMSPGRVSPGVLQRGVVKCSTQDIPNPAHSKNIFYREGVPGI